MRYGLNGKRDKDRVTGKPGWMHNQEGIRERCDMDHHEYRATLFGMHLLNKYPDAAINIVESEKTALIMAIAYGNNDMNLWMACGGLEFLKLESLQPLIDQRRRVWIWPDKDGVEKWTNKVKHLLNDRFNIYTRFFDKYWTEEEGPKADLADINLRLLTRPETINDSKPKEPDEEEIIMYACQEWVKVHEDEPFIDPIEMQDQRVHQWREILRQRYNYKHS